ncbi:hypothetical protein FA10DRAFT_257198 [Acaromyces ingoldii]|uniref:Uncharacterized protein n=1 Tax=Acaromyces ingoldii TaxID=215250 RepID=A0A316YU26_9BASI|nr:hypothetical protein FA10DRAFT_257198 [Acaromyces ingoldii]PWN92769.1 hypothetical protein FA10DRAFT_257198 [Acaromyces ingoldii]
MSSVAPSKPRKLFGALRFNKTAKKASLSQEHSRETQDNKAFYPTNYDYYNYGEPYIVPPAPLAPEAFQPPGLLLDGDAKAEHHRALHVALTKPSAPLSHYRAPPMMTRCGWGVPLAGSGPLYAGSRQPWPSTQYVPPNYRYHQPHRPPRGTLNSPEKVAYLEWRLTAIQNEQLQQQRQAEERQISSMARTSSTTTAGSMTTSTTVATLESRAGHPRHGSNNEGAGDHESSSSSGFSNGHRTAAPGPAHGAILRTGGDWHVADADISSEQQGCQPATSDEATISFPVEEPAAANNAEDVEEVDDDDESISDQYHDPREYLDDGWDPAFPVGQGQPAEQPPPHGRRTSFFHRASLSWASRPPAPVRADSQVSVSSNASSQSLKRSKIFNFLRRNNSEETNASVIELGMPDEVSPLRSGSFATAHASTAHEAGVTQGPPTNLLADGDNVLWRCKAREVDLMR